MKLKGGLCDSGTWSNQETEIHGEAHISAYEKYNCKGVYVCTMISHKVTPFTSIYLLCTTLSIIEKQPQPRHNMEWRGNGALIGLDGIHVPRPRPQLQPTGRALTDISSR